MGRQRQTEQQKANRQLDKDWVMSYKKSGTSGKVKEKPAKGKSKGY